MLGFQGLQRFLRMSEGMQPSQPHRLFGGQQLHLPDKESSVSVTPSEVHLKKIQN